MSPEVVDEVGAGKNQWNSYEIGVKDKSIFIRDEAGYIDFSEEEVDSLIRAIDKARRRLREIKRRPTAENE
ncbi:MAG: hypothetical protein SVV03_05170 [Candidatus Nanohaloarchaea archaeon]|nr:hypothetical protein [Candidatus Nanohaloarchaea archaeon]